MRFHTALLGAVLGALLLSTGCNKDSDVKATLDYLEDTSKAIVSKVTEAEDKKAGVAEATKYLEGRKEDLKTRMTELGQLRGFQVSDEMTAEMATRITGAASEVAKLKITLVAATMDDEELDKAVDALVDAFTEAATPGGG